MDETRDREVDVAGKIIEDGLAAQADARARSSINQAHELSKIIKEFIDTCSNIGTSRELALARTNAEQALMWATKHVHMK